MSEEDPMLSMLKWLCEQMMEAEISSKILTQNSERTEARSAYRSGYRVRRFDTRMNKQLTKEICRIHQESKSRYGAPKIHQSLLRKGYTVSLKRVQRLMREADIRSIVVKKFRPQRSIGTIEERTNLLGQDFTTTSINEKWVADITYIHTLKDGWCYLASVLDRILKKSSAILFLVPSCIRLAEKAALMTMPVSNPSMPV